ncbi:MAG: hypothetical protein RRA51_06895 [Armatimonadota bacterium]|nr:hypothetical protein [Armatimonadota bacterium]
MRSAGCSCQAKKFGGSAEALPSKKLPVAIRQSPFAVSPVANRQSLFAAHYSLFAIRCSLPFWLGRSLALPIFPVPRPTPLVPLKPVA